jgi:hypothetical protein
MTRRLGFGLLLGVLIATTAADAQFGGLIRKAGEAVKKGAPPPEAPPAAPQTSASALGCPVDDAAMDRLLKGMEAERAARDAALKEAASAKTQAQYGACQSELAAGPEMQKVMESLGSLPDNATPAQSQAAMEKFATAMSSLLTEKCGPPPSEARDQLNRKFTEAGKQASDCDGRIREHALRFCQLPAAEQASAQNGGVRVPGTGAKIFWVYTEAEARAYAPRCGQILSLTDALEKQGLQRQAASQD